MLWSKGLARFMASALHFARFSRQKGNCTARATSEIGSSPQTGAMQTELRLRKRNATVQHGRIIVSDVFCSVLHATVGESLFSMRTIPILIVWRLFRFFRHHPAKRTLMHV